MHSSPSTHWLEIEAAAVHHNLGIFRAVVGASTSLACVVKANGYGHGLEQVAPVARGVCDWLAVHNADEARRLREIGHTCPILVMGFVPQNQLDGLDANVHLVISVDDAVEWVARYRAKSGVRIPVHLKIETGTNRQGFDPREIPELCRAAIRNGVDIVGLSTHFANIEDTLEHEFAGRQIDRFEAAVESATTALGHRPPIIHAACSAAALLFRETDFDLIRVGVAAYGHWPSRETRLSWILEHGRNGLDLQPVATWKVQVGQLKRVATGQTVGYGRTWSALRPTTLAILPVGYADGYPRCLGNRARALVNGYHAPVVGRVCMNILMLDVTDVPDVRIGTEAVLLGRQGSAAVTAEELAELSGTINYELLARLSPTIPRVVV